MNLATLFGIADTTTVTAVTDAFTDVADTMTATAGALWPIAAGIAALGIVWKFGKRIIKSA